MPAALIPDEVTGVLLSPTVLPLTIPLADIPVLKKPKTRNPSTTEPPAASRFTAVAKPEIDPFRMVIPSKGGAPLSDIAVPTPMLLELIEKPARSMVTSWR
jgi:hypothetical protein